MLRLFISLLAGSLFGAGLFVSGMTDTTKVQGWLDVFGNWDPTLAFVMGGAILPMMIAWAIAKRRSAPVSGGQFPDSPRNDIDRNLIVGSLLFGAGWGLSGLCPGPSVAALGYGGSAHFVFLAAMLAGMAFAPKVRIAMETYMPVSSDPSAT